MTGARGRYEGVRATVMGLGEYGGGEGAARHLAESGARVTVTDLRGEADLAEAVGRLGGLPISFHLGGHVESDFTETDLVVVNPAVKPGSPFLAAARRAGVRLETEINIFLRECRARVVGVTGSNGKSTTASMIEAMLRESGRRTWAGGNLGGSLLAELDRMGPGDVAVVELSSFQLERLPWGGRAPDVAVALNVTPNHLDWHEDFGAYAAAKRNIVAMQRPGDFAVLNRGDEVIRGWAGAGQGAGFWMGADDSEPCGGRLRGTDVLLWREERREVVSLEKLRLPGPHNRLNAACAAAAAWLAGAAREGIERAVAEFLPLPHRLELVATVGGVRYVEDSASTTPEKAVAALESFEGSIHLIAGGSSKGTPFDAMGRAISARAATAALIGETAGEIEAAVLAAGQSAVRVVRASSLAEAFDAARSAARPGDVVLLSPGCASFGMFRNYLDRAEQFRRLVRRHAEQNGGASVLPSPS